MRALKALYSDTFFKNEMYFTTDSILLHATIIFFLVTLAFNL